MWLSSCQSLQDQQRTTNDQEQERKAGDHIVGIDGIRQRNYPNHDIDEPPGAIDLSHF
jgi:hypothetical protein